MPSGSYRQVYVKCPFYQYDDGRRRITCEGVIDDSILALVFHNRKDYETQMTVFCCAHYRNCEIYRLLLQKYPDKE